MNWLTTMLAMVASACLTMALMNVAIWWQQRTARSNLYFAAASVAAAVFTGFELQMLLASSTADYATAMRSSHVAIWFLMVALMLFLREYLRAGRLWLMWAVIVLRTLSLVVNFTTGVNANFLEISELRAVALWGVIAAVPIGEPNPAMIVGQASVLLLIVFIVDATWTAARQGVDRTRALRIGCALTFFVVAALVEVVLIFWGIAQFPVVFSPLILGLMVAMGYELSRDVASAAQLANERAQLRAQVAHFGRISALGQLSAALAHEINQPLAAILRNAEAADLLLRHEAPDLVEIRAILSDIRSEDSRARAVIDRMRRLLRNEEVNFEAVNAAQLVETVARLVEGEARARGVRVDLAVSASAAEVRADAVQLQQVLLNLAINAFDALEAMPRTNRSVTFGLAAMEGAGAIFSVRDNGPGIAPEVLPQIFEPFYSTKPNGIGMGLTISRAIVEAHGGVLVAQTRPEQGAEFSFAIPVAAPVEQERAS